MIKIEQGEKLFAGIVLTVIGLVGLVYRVTSCNPDTNFLSLMISSIFVISALFGLYIVYITAIKKES